ncbi:DUF2690 domain-containing protein [Microbacterium sp. B2969]|uniref:DUF2690 domain-containing protein n=1 Tax=Microbacterium alkaliflavum TaxID=3248839 RepID=A0ABW7QHN5_9MICO
MSESDPSTGLSSDSVKQFAADLRRLRLAADNPKYSRLQSETGVSRSVLSEAFAGRQLPSARTVDGIVRVCGGDVDRWHDRRDALARGGTPLLDADPPVAPAPRATVPRRTAVLLAVGSFALGVTLSAAAAALVPPNLPPPASDTVKAVARTGEDPGATPCVDDAAVATSQTRADNTLLEIIWSDKCRAGWGRITRYDGLGDGNTVTVVIYPETAPDGPDRQEATEHDVQGAYTNLIVRPSPDTLLCAEGSFTVDGDVIDLGDPICI